MAPMHIMMMEITLERGSFSFRYFHARTELNIIVRAQAIESVVWSARPRATTFISYERETSPNPIHQVVILKNCLLSTEALSRPNFMII